ncbi:MAG: LysR family transcriptional regulator [Actinomycetota bacterium]|jgi:DNA-binding transcriptional LysR family regulator|nr:LysR family transcriptional regulator [Actinomycetota bacterium]MDA8293359.1 LysR family transcriptional regulator [Actinomycetota bacterium]
MPVPEPVPDVTSLDLLRSVADLGSISRAAAVHRMSQPAASMRLRALERQVGTALLHRRPTGARLTPAGEAVVEWSAPVLDGLTSLVTGLGTLREQERPTLRLAASMTVAEYFVPAWLTRLRTTAPDIVASLQMGNSEHVLTVMRTGQADLGFVEGAVVPRDLRSTVVDHDDLVVVVAPGHPWSRRRRPITAEQLARTPLVAREPGSGTRAVVEHALARHAHAPVVGLELGSTTAIKAAVAAGAGVAVIGSSTVRTELESGRLVEVPVSELDLGREVRAVWRREEPLATTARRLLAEVTAPSGDRRSTSPIGRSRTADRFHAPIA